MKSRGFETKMEAILVIAIKALTITFFTSIPSSSLRNKNVDEKILVELMRDMRELKVEMNVLKKDTRSSTLWLIKGLKRFVVRYIWCNNLNYKHDDYGLYADAMKSDIITFKEEKIKNSIMNEPVETNFERKKHEKIDWKKIGEELLFKW